MQHLFLVALGAIAGTLTKGQLRIPQRELGFVYDKGEAGAKVKLAAYIDLTCQGSQEAFSTLLKVADQYKPSRVQLKFYLFSLPHHRHSHTISKAAHVLDGYNSPKGATVYDWFCAVYNNINSLTTAATADKTDVDVLNFLASLAYNVSGIPLHQFKAGVSNVDIHSATTLEWRYGVTRGVYDAPLFTVNDVFVNVNYKWTVEQWTDLINPLLTGESSIMDKYNLYNY